jgi:hypothetical protein
MTSFFDMPPPYADLATSPGRPPTRLGGGPFPSPRSPRVSGLEYFFDGLLIVMALVIVWFAYFSVKKLYQGQR